MRDMLTFLIGFQQPFLTIWAWKSEIKNTAEIKMVKFNVININHIVIIFQIFRKILEN